MTPDRATGDRRKKLAVDALELYNTPMTVREVSEKLGCSYGKAHALITQAGGEFRRRGTRAGSPSAVPAEEAADGDL